MFAHAAAGGIARAGAVAVVVVVLRAPAEDGGEGKEYGERGQPQHGAAAFAVAQREKQRQQQRESRALQAGGGDAVAQAAFEDGRLYQRRIIKRRMNKNVLISYCARLGYDIADDLFWKCSQSILLERIVW